MIASKSRRSSPLPLEAVTIALLGVLYGPLLWHWVDGWLNKSISIQHEYFSHGLLGIPFAAYLVWEQRSQWQALPHRTHWFSFTLMLGAIAFYSSGLVDLMNLSLPLLLAGVLLTLKGVPGFRLYLFPWILVLLSTPTQLPYLIEPYVLPLQAFIASVAGFILLQFDVDVQVDGIYLSVSNQLVEVAPHCAGLKMLFTSLYMGLILIYWTGLHRSRLRTGLFFIGIVCISVVGNIIRNATLTYFHGAQMDKAFDWLHESWGGDLYSAAMLGMLIVLIRLFEQYAPDSLKISNTPGLPPGLPSGLPSGSSHHSPNINNRNTDPSHQPLPPVTPPRRPDYF
ncbi:MAG: cyanoexosortase B [Phormidesmis sp.]